MIFNEKNKWAWSGNTTITYCNPTNSTTNTERLEPSGRQLSRDMRFPTMWYVRPAKAQTSLRICAVWSKPLLVAWIFYDCYATDQASFGVSMLERRPHRLVWVYTCQNATLLEITCHGSITLKQPVLSSIAWSFILADLANPVGKFKCKSHAFWLPIRITLNRRLEWNKSHFKHCEYQSRDMWFPTMWHFDINRLRRTCTASL